MYLITAKTEAVGPGNTGEFVSWTIGQKRWIEDELVGFYNLHPDAFDIGDQSVDPIQQSVETAGYPASAFIAFTGAGEEEMTVTIGGIVYAEADTAAPASGAWTNGASAADSAASLTAAINGDKRTAVPFVAVADESGDGLWLFWSEVGDDGDLTITTDSEANCTVPEEATPGMVPTRQRVVNLTKTVTTAELASGTIDVPLPFAPSGYHVTAYSSTGAVLAFSDLVTVEEDPDRLRFTTNGDTALVNTDVVHITAWE